ncbi:SIS domain-containing protein [Rubrobacter naiadicus]|uniref:SIS domain-containing protein n=1 Tax=Rubrobacter naiadicus TaxID=1392641 RepID=UPI00235F3907|nr:SIS domain-containing protein [Rubrobacter naiadicus]
MQPGTGIETYLSRVRRAHQEIERERPNLVQAARLLADSLEGEPDRVIHVFGTGHSHLLVEEAFWRAGGLVPVNPILDPNLTAFGGSRASALERLEGYAEVLLSGEEVREGEAMVIFSNSGINAVPVEMALGARERGLVIVAITSLAHSRSVESRHPSGRKLFELADATIDTHVPPGDAAVELSGVLGDGADGLRAGPISTVVGAALLNALVVEVACLRAASGAEPPVFASQNLPGVEERNETLLDRYRPRSRFYR